jgi:hypothetical protein
MLARRVGDRPARVRVIAERPVREDPLADELRRALLRPGERLRVHLVGDLATRRVPDLLERDRDAILRDRTSSGSTSRASVPQLLRSSAARIASTSSSSAARSAPFPSRARACVI